jgi:hypothetical protein
LPGLIADFEFKANDPTVNNLFKDIGNLVGTVADFGLLTPVEVAGGYNLVLNTEALGSIAGILGPIVNNEDNKELVDILDPIVEVLLGYTLRDLVNASIPKSDFAGISLGFRFAGEKLDAVTIHYDHNGVKVDVAIRNINILNTTQPAASFWSTHFTTNNNATNFKDSVVKLTVGIALDEKGLDLEVELYVNPANWDVMQAVVVATSESAGFTVELAGAYHHTGTVSRVYFDVAALYILLDVEDQIPANTKYYVEFDIDQVFDDLFGMIGDFFGGLFPETPETPCPPTCDKECCEPFDFSFISDIFGMITDVIDAIGSGRDGIDMELIYTVISIFGLELNPTTIAGHAADGLAFVYRLFNNVPCVGEPCEPPCVDGCDKVPNKTLAIRFLKDYFGLTVANDAAFDALFAADSGLMITADVYGDALGFFIIIKDTEKDETYLELWLEFDIVQLANVPGEVSLAFDSDDWTGAKPIGIWGGNNDAPPITTNRDELFDHFRLFLNNALKNYNAA